MSQSFKRKYKKQKVLATRITVAYYYKIIYYDLTETSLAFILSGGFHFVKLDTQLKLILNGMDKQLFCLVIRHLYKWLQLKI